MTTYRTEHPAIDVETLRAVTAAAADVYAAASGAHAASAYLRQRGIDTSGLDSSWLIGYAPPGWTRLVYTLRRDFPDEILLESGLARRSSRGTLIDAFRDRVIFGVRDTDGTVAGFIGRDLSGHPDAPKYLNTPHNVLFDKSSLLYALYEGTHARGAGQPVVVEGPLDVLAIAARTTETPLLPLAPCGTAFTLAHAKCVAELAFKHHLPVVVALDGDAPGRLAALAAGERLRRTGLDVRIATLPNGLDPADYLSQPNGTVDAFRAANATPLLTARVEHEIAAQGDRVQWIEGRLRAARAISRYLAGYPVSFAVRQVGWLAHTLNLDASTITQEIADAYRDISSLDRPEGWRIDRTSVCRDGGDANRNIRPGI